MEHLEIFLIFLFVAVAGISTVARMLSIPYPILLVLGGLVLGLLPGLPEVQLEPDLVLVIFSPPLLFFAAFQSSWRDLRADARAITLTSIGLVLATTCGVAVIAHEVIDGMPWAMARLGAIVSPTDPVAATAIMRRIGVPRRIVTVVEARAWSTTPPR